MRGEKGTLVMFICNHCPYVKAVIDRIVRDVKELEAHGIKAVAISANDAEHYPDDSFDNMKRFAAEHGLTFPYLYDESQDVARAYDATCTPDFFGFNADHELQYRGRLDESRKEAAAPHVRRDLFEAMKQIADDGAGASRADPVDRLRHQVEGGLAPVMVRCPAVLRGSGFALAPQDDGRASNHGRCY